MYQYQYQYQYQDHDQDQMELLTNKATAIKNFTLPIYQGKKALT